MLPIWGRGCVLPHWPVTGEGAGRGGGAAPPAECSRRPGLAPHLLFGRCTCSCSLPHWEKSVEGDARLGWLPCSPWKTSVGYASLLLAPETGGTKAAPVILCPEAAPWESR